MAVFLIESIRDTNSDTHILMHSNFWIPLVKVVQSFISTSRSVYTIQVLCMRPWSFPMYKCEFPGTSRYFLESPFVCIHSCILSTNLSVLGAVIC